MKKVLAGALIAAAVMGGCGGDDEESTTTQGSQQTEPTQATEQTTTESSGPANSEVPTYEQVVKVALKNDSVKKACAGGEREDRDIGSYPGETYKRLFCKGVPRMDYVVGKEAVTENVEAAREGRSPIWRLDDEAYASGPPLDDEFAKGIKDLCGCGEVVPGKPN